MKYFTTSDGLTLGYRDRGTGVPLLCLPGLTRNGEDFAPVADAFDSRARVIRLDLRGRGESDYDPDFSHYNVLVEGRDAVELLDHLGLEKAAVLGTSRGGLIAMLLAATVGDRLTGAMLVDVGPELDPVGLERIMGYVGRRPQQATLDALAAAMAVDNAEQFPGVSVSQWRTFAARTVCETGEGLELRYDPKLLDALVAGAAEGQAAPDLWPAFDALAGLPLALVRGANSDLLSAATTAEMRRRRPDMIFAEVPDRGHIPFLDEPESQAAIAAFLDALDFLDALEG
jgi:pimeloyl-ACP methyl ester carboxylesterase